MHKYDLTGRELHSRGMDNGTRWSLPDATGAPAQSWKGEATAGEHWFMMRPEYDVLRRPTKLWETVDWESSSPPEPKCRVLSIYGEELSNPADDNYLGRMRAQYDSGGATITQGYGLQGNPLSVKRTLALFTANKGDSTAGVLAADPDYTTASAITTSFSDLDTSARLQLESESFVNEMSYDALGRVVESVAAGSDPAARAVHTYGYGKSGALSSIDVKDRTGQTHQILTYVEHNARGQRTRLERGNGVSSTFSYDPHSFRVTSIRAKKDAGPTIQELQYTYDTAGNVLRVKDAAQQNVYFSNTVVEPVQTFVVDALYRLVEATGREHAPVFGLDPSVLPQPSLGLPSDDVLQTYTRGYTYDAAGNMLKIDVQGGWTRDLTVAADSNRLVEVAHGDDSTTLIALASDQFGNMLQVPNVDVLKWDRAGNLRFSQSTADSNRRVWYQYGSDNQRVRKVVEVRTNSAAEWRRERETLYLGGQEFYRTYDGSEALDYERDTVHVMDGDRREAMLEGDADGVNIRYMLSDHLRSASVELAHDGEVISYETFHPYGTTAYYSVSESGGVAAKRYRYSGKERDAETGLDCYGYRYLCSWLGRWVSADPAGTVDGVNLFAFALSNPSRYLDGDGRESYDMDAARAAAFSSDIGALWDAFYPGPNNHDATFYHRESYCTPSSMAPIYESHGWEPLLVDRPASENSPAFIAPYAPPDVNVQFNGPTNSGRTENWLVEFRDDEVVVHVNIMVQAQYTPTQLPTQTRRDGVMMPTVDALVLDVESVRETVQVAADEYFNDQFEFVDSESGRSFNLRVEVHTDQDEFVGAEHIVWEVGNINADSPDDPIRSHERWIYGGASSYLELVAHELGHVVGLPDEYVEPGRDTLQFDDDSLMADHRVAGASLKLRHGQWIAGRISENLSLSSRSIVNFVARPR